MPQPALPPADDPVMTVGGDAVVIGPWLSASDAAAHLGLPVRTVLELAREGASPAIRGPVGAPRFRDTDVLAFGRRTA
jgi:hypothetical protein